MLNRRRKIEDLTSEREATTAVFPAGALQVETNLVDFVVVLVALCGALILYVYIDLYSTFIVFSAIVPHALYSRLATLLFSAFELLTAVRQDIFSRREVYLRAALGVHFADIVLDFIVTLPRVRVGLGAIVPVETRWEPLLVYIVSFAMSFFVSVVCLFLIRDTASELVRSRPRFITRNVAYSIILLVIVITTLKLKMG